MRPLARPMFGILAFVFVLTFTAKAVRAQDPVQVDPDHYKVIYENTEVRVLRYDDTPGHLVPKHTHPHNYVVYVITPAVRQFFKQDCTTKDGGPKSLTADQVLKPVPIPMTHCEKNVGVTDTHLIIIENKKLPAPADATRGRQRRPARSSRQARP